MLLRAYRVLAQAIKDERSITPAAEWLVDNFHVVEEQLREIRDDLPGDYYRELPKLADGHLEGYPRVLGLTWAYVAHTDSRFDPESLRRLVIAYQRVEPLTIGELWAVAITLRILLVENLRRLAEQIVRSRAARQEADELADSLLGLGDESPERAAATLRKLRRLTLPTAGKVQLFQRLRDQDPAVTPALRRLEELLATEGTTAEETVRLEHQRQAVDERHGSERHHEHAPDLVVRLGAVRREREPCRRDAARDERIWRDGLRHARSLSPRHRGACPELGPHRGRGRPDGGGMADRRWQPTRPDAGRPSAAAPRDPGWFLISDGRPALERALARPRCPRATRLRRAYLRAATPAYLGSLALVTALVLARPDPALAAGRRSGLVLWSSWPSWLSARHPTSRSPSSTGLSSSLLGPARAAPSRARRRRAHRSCGRWSSCPTLLGNVDDVEEQVGRPRDPLPGQPRGRPSVRPAVGLAGCADRTRRRRRRPARGRRGRDRRLNARHGEAPGGGARFLLFHRKRRWNEAEGVWMGWERKRGKLHELNALLRGSTDDRHPDHRAPRGRPRPTGVRYVVTLDSDTRLPARRRGPPGRDDRPPPEPAALRRGDGSGHRRATGSSSHGSPRPCRPSTRRRSSSASTRAPPGIDPYASAISDVYQDLFGEGSYTGKGIYDLDAFEAAMADRTPENALLSHDLFEGIFARAGPGRPTSSCSTSTRRTTSRRRPGSTAGRVATGSSCRGSSGRARDSDGSPAPGIRCRRSVAGR